LRNINTPHKKTNHTWPKTSYRGSIVNSVYGRSPDL